MKDLLEIRDELNVARSFVECAFQACHAVDGADGIVAVLDAASDKLKAIGEALELFRGSPNA